ncbi:MAG TPA: endolytic transglycosylase MltG [Pyrinomonadaceae bacterium]|nr:endolytic transglycosylase MltG [Pyrinomonadaceae bacterium]
MIRKLIIAIVLLVLIAVAAGGVFWYWLQNAMNTPISHAKGSEYITIDRGTPPAAIVGKLVSEGILANGTPVLIYLRTFGDASKIKAGDYKFPTPISPIQVLAELEKGEERSTRLVIPEGFTRFDIAKRIAEKFPLQVPMDEKQILALMDDTSLINDIAPDAKNLEGYMYPSTYSLPPDATADEIVKTMVEQFRKIWKPDWAAKAKSIGRTPHEIITIASLIETETGVPAERPIVASVINNRLAKSIPLGIDMTNIYIAKMEGRWDGTINKSDLEVNSPYNTRTRSGIPPGPISSVSVTAIEAALNPAQTDYIYYVRNVQLNDGSHHFYASAADFERGKAEYQQWLEKERQEKRANEANNSNSQQ